MPCVRTVVTLATWSSISARVPVWPRVRVITAISGLTMIPGMTMTDDFVTHCDDCDLTFVGLHATWYEDAIAGVSECPECGDELDVWPIPELHLVEGL